jgi:hypothetical protein
MALTLVAPPPALLSYFPITSASSSVARRMAYGSCARAMTGMPSAQDRARSRVQSLTVSPPPETSKESAIPMTIVFQSTFVADSVGNAGISVRQTVPNIAAGGNQVRVTFNASTEGYDASHASIGVQSSGMNTVAPPVELTFAGRSGFGLPASGGSIVSDWVNLTTLAGETLVVIIDVTSYDMSRNTDAGSQGWNLATQSWNEASPPGSWNSFGSVGSYGFCEVEIQTASSQPANVANPSPGIPGGGRLTLLTTPQAPFPARLNADTSSSLLAYAPDKGTTAPQIDGSGNLSMQPFTSGPTDITGPQLTLDPVNYPAGAVFDFFIAPLNGARVLCSGPARVAPNYAPAVPDALYNGVACNGAPMQVLNTALNGGAPFTVAQYQGKFVGTIMISPIGGVVRVDFSQKQGPQCGIWNSDNQAPMTLSALGQQTGSDVSNAYNLASSWGLVNGDPTSGMTILQGRANARPSLQLFRRARTLANTSSGSRFATGIGWNQQNAPSGMWGGFNVESALYINTGSATPAVFTAPAFMGVAQAWPLEEAPGGQCQAWVTPPDVLFEGKFPF